MNGGETRKVAYAHRRVECRDSPVVRRPERRQVDRDEDESAAGLQHAGNLAPRSAARPCAGCGRMPRNRRRDRMPRRTACASTLPRTNSSARGPERVGGALPGDFEHALAEVDADHPFAAQRPQHSHGRPRSATDVQAGANGGVCPQVVRRPRRGFHPACGTACSRTWTRADRSRARLRRAACRASSKNVGPFG